MIAASRILAGTDHSLSGALTSHPSTLSARFSSLLFLLVDTPAPSLSPFLLQSFVLLTCSTPRLYAKRAPSNQSLSVCLCCAVGWIAHFLLFVSFKGCVSSDDGTTFFARFCGLGLLLLELSCFARSSIRGRTLAIVAGHEYGEYGEEVVLEFALAAGSRLGTTLVLNHDFTPGTLEDVLDELKGEAAEAISVGDHNLLDVSAHRSVQNGEETGPLPVDARGNVLDDLVLWERILEGLDLSLEGVLLRGTRHSGVADPGPASLCCRDRFLGVLRPGPITFEHGLDVGSLVQALAVASETHGGDPAGLCSTAQGGRGDAQGGLDGGCRDVFVVVAICLSQDVHIPHV